MVINKVNFTDKKNKIKRGLHPTQTRSRRSNQQSRVSVGRSALKVSHVDYLLLLQFFRECYQLNIKRVNLSMAIIHC